METDDIDELIAKEYNKRNYLNLKCDCCGDRVFNIRDCIWEMGCVFCKKCWHAIQESITEVKEGE